jgi:CheY-like chemotaxis protein
MGYLFAFPYRLRTNRFFYGYNLKTPGCMANVLIVDDDEDDRDLFCTAVHELEPKINCILARNGEEALQGLRLEKFLKPDLIFLDLNMPRFNGIQFLREVKKDNLLPIIPIVIYTASQQQQDLEEAKELGAAHFLAKPSSFKELCRIIGEIFAKEMIYLK